MAFNWYYNEGDCVGNLKLLEKTTVTEGIKYPMKRSAWICKCELCGEIVTVTTIGLKNRKLGKDAACTKCTNKHPKFKTHGMTGTRIHRIWKNIKGRCSGKSGYENNKRYFERGIRVCDEWANSFEAFYEWAMTNGYEDNLEIDRIDNDKGYSPDNCRWLTHKENCHNRPQYKGN